jgi:NADPH:quinone reductase-like Zn-dependent oxidoreductase
MSAPSADEAAARDARNAFVFTQMNASQLGEIAALVDKGVVKVHVTKALPLEKAGEAQELLEAHGVVGKLVLTIR